MTAETPLGVTGFGESVGDGTVDSAHTLSRRRSRSRERAMLTSDEHEQEQLQALQNI